MTEIIFVLLYLLLLLWLERCHRAERRELYDRMSFRETEQYIKHRDGKKHRMPEYPFNVAAKKWRDADGGR